MSPITAEDRARHTIDTLLGKAGWQIFDAKQANIHAARGVAIREFPLKAGHGEADYLLYVDGKAAGVIEAKKEGATLTGVEIQSISPPEVPAADPFRNDVLDRRPTLKFLVGLITRRDNVNHAPMQRAKSVYPT